MDTLTLVNKLCDIFLDLALPLIVAWIGYSMRSWLPKEISAHQQMAQLQRNIEELKPKS